MWPRAALTLIAGVHSLRQQQTAQLTLSPQWLLHLDQVGRHAEWLVADLILMVLPDAAG